VRRFGFDATSLSAAGKGVARFQQEFLEAASEQGVDSLDVFLADGAEVGELPSPLGWRYHRVAARPMIAWEQFRRPLLARRLGLELTITLSERAALWGPPEAAYVFEHPGHRVRRNREVGVPLRQRLVDLSTLALFALAMRRARVVLAASASTAADLASLRAARVVYSGVSHEFSPGTEERAHVLHIASDDPRDNSAVVLEAYAAAGAGLPPLVVAGPVRAVKASLLARAQALGIADRISWPGFQTTDSLVTLYRGAIAYVDPSFYEGFGLQAAEAVACGTPVIASNRTSLPEVVGDAGVLLDPLDVAGFAAALRRIVDDASFAADLHERALAQAGRFTWSETVRETFAACEEAVSTRR
jgi:glycosyltransferase involved in cell wall biosynthesis